jgi:preprotein translocase subunit SecG
MQQIMTIVQILVSVGLIALVLLQQGKGADAGAAFGSGGSSTIFGSRGSASFLSRATAVLAVLFFCNSIALAYISGQSVDRQSVTERFGVSGEAPASSEPVPKAGEFVTDVPDLPAADGSKSPGEGGSDVPDAPDSSGEQKTQ